MKRFFAVLVVSLLCLTLFSACVKEDKFVYRISEDVDFGGQTIYYTCGWVNAYVPSEDDDGSGTAATNYGEALLKHYKNFIEKYNVKSIEGIAGSHTDKDGNILMSLLAGTDKSTFIDLSNAVIYNFYKLDLLWAFNDLTNVDLSETEIYGSPDYLKAVTFDDGKTYAMKCDGAWQPEYVGNGYMFYNANLVKQFNADDPWQLYKEGKWTFSNFSSYLDTVCDMSLDEPIYGMEIYQDESTFMYSSIFANGGTLYNNESGSWKFSMLTDTRTVNALAWAAAIEGKDCVVKEDVNSGFFSNGKATIFQGSTAIYNETIKNYEDIYYIPFPTGSDVKPGEKFYSSFMSGTRMLCVPVGRDPDEAGNFMSLYFSELEDAPLALRRATDKRNNFFSDDSYSCYYEESVHGNFTGAGYPLSASNTALVQALVNIGKGQSYSSALSAISNQVQRDLDQVFNN